ncbi:MAG: diacylglycerol kinase family protein [Candidatus Saccharibacteria bacterium]|nr:diacylglycerol kinase family protein [Candidatus Saccharibacteria bacterium]
MSWQKDEIVLVINQDSRRSLSKAKVLQKLAKSHHLRTVTCAGSDLDYTLRRELNNTNLKRLIIAGGDGSIALAASLISKLKKYVEIAVIPVGTANYYAKTLGIKSIAGAFSIATNGQKDARYLCKANGRIFMMIADIGVTSRMLEQVTDIEKKRFGKLAYFWGIIRLFLSFQPMKVTIEANGETNTYATTEVMVVNQSLNERVPLQPKVDSREPYFEIVTFGVKHTKMSSFLAIIIFILTLGNNQKYLKRIKATEAVITTDREEVVSLDGDSLEATPLKIRLIKEPIYFVSDN